MVIPPVLLIQLPIFICNLIRQWCPSIKCHHHQQQQHDVKQNEYHRSSHLFWLLRKYRTGIESESDWKTTLEDKKIESICSPPVSMTVNDARVLLLRLLLFLSCNSGEGERTSWEGRWWCWCLWCAVVKVDFVLLVYLTRISLSLSPYLQMFYDFENDYLLLLLLL